jgi:signal transduction histidine kinase
VTPQTLNSAQLAEGSINANDLAELMATFNEVTAKLGATHESLRAEVGRLNDELREANERLARSKRLAALGEMAAGIAHEIRNPLGSISLYANMLVEDLADLPDQQAISRKINVAVRGLDAIVGDVLSFARETRPSLDEVDAGLLMDRAVEACQPADAQTRASITIERLFEHGQIEFMCDPSLVHQALVNVLRNAIEAACERDAAKAHIRLNCTEREAAPGRREVILSVQDNGLGVTDEVVERMFNPFFTTRAVGTGLGLPIVHRIVDAHGGRVEVGNNKDNCGARVELVFPNLGEDQREHFQRSAMDRPGICEQEAFV